MNLPQFLYIPRVNTLGITKLIFETRKHVYWQICEFDDLQARKEWVKENQVAFEAGEIALSVNLHGKYPYALLCVGLEKGTDSKELVKLGNMASDWYAQFWIKNKKLTKPKFEHIGDLGEKAKEYFKHWIWGDNLISSPGMMCLVNLEYGVSIRFDYGDAFFADFEDFQSQISDVQFLNGQRPDAEIVERLTVDAWNFMGIQERIEDGYGMEEIDSDIF